MSSQISWSSLANLFQSLQSHQRLLQFVLWSWCKVPRNSSRLLSQNATALQLRLTYLKRSFLVWQSTCIAAVQHRHNCISFAWCVLKNSDHPSETLRRSYQWIATNFTARIAARTFERSNTPLQTFKRIHRLPRVSLEDQFKATKNIRIKTSFCHDILWMKPYHGKCTKTLPMIQRSWTV